jgi:hypothetical protein
MVKLMHPGAFAGPEAAAKTAQWARARYLRLAVALIAWLGALMALSQLGKYSVESVSSAKNLEIEALQTVFMVFYAIFWGAIANAQPRWKAFQWPLVFKKKFPQPRRRALVALLVLNILPLFFFAYGMWALYGRGPTVASPLAGSLHYFIRGVVPAFAVFGLYRFWLAVVELYPAYFYAASMKDIDEKYHHVEPTYRHKLDERKGPVVDLGPDTGWMNFLFGLGYVIVGLLAPWCPLP